MGAALSRSMGKEMSSIILIQLSQKMDKLLFRVRRNKIIQQRETQ